MKVETIPDIELIEHLDFDAELACEGVSHAAGENGHVSSEQAPWLSISPCCGMRLLLCDSWVQLTLAGGFLGIICEPGCGQISRIDENTFIPLDIK